MGIYLYKYIDLKQTILLFRFVERLSSFSSETWKEDDDPQIPKELPVPHFFSGLNHQASPAAKQPPSSRQVESKDRGRQDPPALKGWTFAAH